MRLQLHSSTTGSIAVDAPYITDHIEAQLTRADSGVAVTMADSVGQLITRLSAHRLVLDHRANTVALSGSVLVRAPAQGISLRTDTLTWDRTEDVLEGPEGVEVELSNGRLLAARLRGGSDLARWSATQVRSVFRDTSTTADEVQIDAPTAEVAARDGSVLAVFDSASVRWRSRQVRAARVTYDGSVDVLRLRGAVGLQDSLRSIQADSVDLELVSGRLSAGGSVRVTGDMTLRADALTEDGDGRWLVSGAPLRLEIDARELTAGRLTLSAGTDTVSASGNAQAQEAGRVIHADSIVLLRDLDEMQAAGHILVVASDLQGSLEAGAMRIAGAGGPVLLWQGARLRRPRQELAELTLSADTLQLQPDGRRLVGLGRFVLASPPRVVLRAHQGAYQAADDTAGQAVADTALLSGETAFVYDRDGSSSLLSADTCQVVLHLGMPTAVVWPSPLQGHVQDAEQMSWLQADRGRGDIADGQLTRLDLEGDVEVTHKGEGEHLSRFTAQTMSLQYGEDGVLQSVQAEGGALVRSRTAAGAVNEVGGEQLEVSLRHGAVAAIHVLRAIEGRFVPDDEDSREK